MVEAIAIDIQAIFKGTIAVHLTNFFPQKKRIRTRFSVNPLQWFRDTVHFTLNQPVQDLNVFQTGSGAAVWSDKKFCILMPFDKLYALNGKHLQRFSPEDTFFTRSVLLPEGTMVIIMPEGDNDAIENGIVTHDELVHSFGDIDPRKANFIPYLQKQVESIVYRILNYNLSWKIIDVAIAAINELGYSLDFFADKNIPQINGCLGLRSSPHQEHWTHNLEVLKIYVDNHKITVDRVRSIVRKLLENGIVLPISTKDDWELGRFIDARGRIFTIFEIHSLTDQERRAAEDFCWSIVDPENRSGNLQYPILYAQSLLRSVPSAYHNAIRFYVVDYQRYVREHLVKEIRELFPGLEELINARLR